MITSWAPVRALRMPGMKPQSAPPMRAGEQRDQQVQHGRQVEQ